MYVWLDDLDQALAAGAVPFVEVLEEGADYTASPSWRTRGRPSSTGEFRPEGVLCHHTASPAGTSDQADLNAILWGNSQAPGPVSQLYIGRTGVVYLVAAGRCNHGGKGRRPGVDQGGCADMNALLVGIEAGNNGIGEPWPDVQTDVYAATVAALCNWYGWETDQVWLHATTGPPGEGCNSKIDPAGPWQLEPDLGGHTWNLAMWRGFIDDHRAPPSPPEEEIVTEQDKADIAARVWEYAVRNFQAGEDQPAAAVLGWAHSEAFGGGWDRTAVNATDGITQTLRDLVVYAHLEAHNANEKCDRILAALGVVS